MAALRYPAASRALLRFQQSQTYASSSHAAKKYDGTILSWSSHANGPMDYRPMRLFHESLKHQNRFDKSSIDFAYMPQHTLEGAAPPEVMRIPLLPHNDSQTNHEETDESVIRPQISLVSANSTHIESPSAMSEVTDNHAVDLDPYDLTNRVTAAASKIASVPMTKMGEAGTVRQLWTGLMDDLFGSKPVSRA